MTAKEPPGLQCNPPGKADLGRTSPGARVFALESAGDFREAQSARIEFPRFAGYAGRAFGRGFAFRVLVSRPRLNRDSARDIPRAAISSLIPASPATDCV